MGLFLPQRFSRQPQGPVAIDWGNPLSRGLVLDWSAVNPTINSIDGQRVVAASPSPINALQVGRARDFTNSAFGDTSFGPDYFPLIGENEATFEVLLRQTGASFYAPLVAKFGSQIYFRCHNNAIEIGSNLVGFLSGTNGSFANNVWIYAVGTLNAYGLLKTFVNGKLIDSLQGTPITSYFNNKFYPDNTSVFEIGPTFKGQIAFARMRKIPLNEAEIRALAQNPWQIYRPSRAVFVSLGPSFQFSRPTTDVLTGWTRVPASGTHVSAINETVSNQSDYLQATSPTLVDSFTMGELQQPSDGALAINFDIDSSQRATTIELLNGGTVVKSATIGSVTLPVGRFLSQRWRQQPQRPVEIDWNNPITRGLILCISPSNPLREITQGYLLTIGNERNFQATPNGLAFVRGNDGAAGELSQSIGYGSVPGTEFDITSPQGGMTAAIVSGAIPQVLSGNNAGVFASIAFSRNDPSNASTEDVSFAVQQATANSILMYLFNGIYDGSASSFSAAIPTSQVRGQNVFFGYVPEISTTYFKTAIGSTVINTSSGNGISLYTNTGSKFTSYGGNSARQSIMTMGLWWKRELSAAERGSMQDNPWQIFRAARTRLYSVPSVNNATTINVSSAELTGVTWPWTPTVRITSQ
jgi:hypothetical protein